MGIQCGESCGKHKPGGENCRKGGAAGSQGEGQEEGGIHVRMCTQTRTTYIHIPTHTHTLIHTHTHTHTQYTFSLSHTLTHAYPHNIYKYTHRMYTHTPQHAWDFSMMPKPQVGVKSRAHRPAGRCAESEQVSMQEGMTGREDLEMLAFLPSGNRQGTRGCLISSTSLPVSGVTDLLEIFVVTFLPRCSLTEQKAKASCDKWPEDCIFA